MERIDRESWGRREVFDFFSQCDWPFYAVTLPVEVTGVKAAAKARGLSFYHLMVWACTKAANAVPDLRLRVRGEEIVRLDRADPSFTVMGEGEEVFRIITLPWEEDPEGFCRRAEEAARTQRAFLVPEEETDGLIYISCTPWFDFTALTNERRIDPDDTVPRLAWGRYYEDRGGLWVHLSVEVNHRTVDGYHIGQFKAALDREIAALGGEHLDGFAV